MAIWKETLEPYVKVIESTKTAPLNPTAGGDLIIGAVIISDSGSSTPKLITSQKEFLANYATSEITEEYMAQLDSLYTSDPGSSLASTMWLNAYRLAGSTTLLVSRAVNGGDIVYAKALERGNNNDYIIKDTEILRRSSEFKFVLDENGDSDGWAIAISEVGILGNRISDDGPLYDFDIYNLPDLVDKLNETTQFYSSHYVFYDNQECNDDSGIITDITEDNKDQVKAVVFKEVYLANGFLDTTDPRLEAEDGNNYGFIGIVPEAPVEGHDIAQFTVHLSNLPAFAKYTKPKYYVSNVYNSNTDLQVRIRRFNHNAVQQKTLSDAEQAQGVSPWIVLTNALDKFTGGGLREPTSSVLDADFYEFAIKDPSISEDWTIFNIGNKSGRGDVTMATLNDSLGMMQLHLPNNLRDLGLNYYDYPKDDAGFELTSGGHYNDYTGYYTVNGIDYLIDSAAGNKGIFATKAELDAYISSDQAINTGCYIVGEPEKVDDDYDYSECTFYQYLKDEEISANCQINPKKSRILHVSNSTIMKAWDAIEEDERYIVEGVTDLGCTYSIIQNYIANMAIHSNYFYPVSTINSTNYLTIANFAQKITPMSHKLYFLAPWDYDDGTVGFLFNVSPSIMYWEVVSRNRLNNMEFAAAFGMIRGIINPVNLSKEFNKSQRQLLLTKNINTIFHDLYNELYYINDNKTREASEDILIEDCNSRFQIRISKAMPVLLRQFHGRQINNVLFKDIRSVIDYWFKDVVLGYGYTVAEYDIICSSANNTDEDARARRVNVKVNVRYYNTSHYIEVYNVAYPLGIAFDQQ